MIFLTHLFGFSLLMQNESPYDPRFFNDTLKRSFRQFTILWVNRTVRIYFLKMYSIRVSKKIIFLSFYTKVPQNKPHHT